MRLRTVGMKKLILVVLLLCLGASEAKPNPYVATVNKQRWRKVGGEQYSAKGVGITETSGSVISCAKIYSDPNFSGQVVNFTPVTRTTELYAFVTPRSVQVRKGCRLTTIDSASYQMTYYQNITYNWWGWYQYPITGGCCQCDGCNGELAFEGVQCARLYQFTSCNSCSGFRLSLNHGDNVANLGFLNNMMTSVVVRPGCWLLAHDQPNFSMHSHRINFTRPFDDLRELWNQQISSLKCHCNNGEITLPTQPPIVTIPTIKTSKWPPVTLPTVPTSKSTSKMPQITLPTVPTTRWPPVTLPTVTTTTPLPTVSVLTNKPKSWEEEDWSVVGWDNDKQDSKKESYDSDNSYTEDYEESDENGNDSEDFEASTESDTDEEDDNNFWPSYNFDSKESPEDKSDLDEDSDKDNFWPSNNSNNEKSPEGKSDMDEDSTVENTASVEWEEESGEFDFDDFW